MLTAALAFSCLAVFATVGVTHAVMLEPALLAAVKTGKAIGAFERSLRVKKNALDDYIAGDVNALVPAEKKALQVFFVAGCVQCHWGPRMTDDVNDLGGHGPRALLRVAGHQPGHADARRIR